MRATTAKAVLAGLLVATIIYGSGYGMLRGRKLLVRREYHTNRKAGPLVTDIAAGRDLRRSGVGAAKNAIAPIAETAYAPPRCIEAIYWNRSRR